MNKRKSIKKTNTCKKASIRSTKVPVGTVSAAKRAVFKIQNNPTPYFDEVYSIEKAASMVASGKKKDLLNYEKLLLTE